MAHSTITCLTWVKRGVAKETPDKVELSQEQLKKLFKNAQDGLQNSDDNEEESQEDDTTAESDAVSDEGCVVKVEDVEETEEDELAKYGLDKYDDEDDIEAEPMEDGQSASHSALQTCTLPSLTMYATNEEDPHITTQDDEEEDEFEKEDFLIKPTDNLVVVGKVHEEYGNLEIYVYNEEEGALYVHHDILLPAFPLALEWLNFDPAEENPGNLVAIGTMIPTIDVWDIDVVDCLEPAFTLGVSKSKLRKNKSSNFQGHSDAVLDLTWNRLVPNVLASGSADNTVALWDMGEMKPVSVIKKHTDKVQSLKWHPFEAQSLLSGGFDKTVKIYDCRSPNEQFQEWMLDGEVERVLWNHFQPFTFLASTDTGFVCCFDVRSPNDPIFRLKAHDDAVTGLTLNSQVAGCLVTASADNMYKVWDIQDNKPSLVVSKDPKMKAIHCLQGNPDSPFVVAKGGERDNLRVTDILSHAPVANHFGDRPRLAIPTPDVMQSSRVFGSITPQGADTAESTTSESSAASTSSKKSRRKRKKKKNPNT